MYQPEVAEGLEEAALTHREVVFDFHGTESIATARLTAILDTVDALDLQAAISDLAATMGRLGDTSPVGVRRAHALGLLAHPQRTLELFGTSTRLTPPLPSRAGVVREWNATPATLYLHVSTDDLRAAALGDANHGGTVERLGAATLDLLADWLRRTDRSPSARSSTRPGSPRWTATTRPTRCGKRSCCATGTACSPAAPSTPGPATSTTSTPTCHLTTADHRARQASRTLPACAADTTD